MQRLGDYTRSLTASRTASQSIVRAATAVLLSHLQHKDHETILRECWPHDQNIGMVLRAATSPATSTDAATASLITAGGVGDVLSVLGPASAGATLMSRGLKFTFDGVGFISVPGAMASKSNASFVKEGAPIPVRQLNTSGSILLTPKKFATITDFTSEIFEHSLPNVETSVRQILSESVGLALDDKMFDSTAADDTRPSGLRAGIAALTASSLTGAEAMAADVSKLVGAVAGVAGNNPIIFIAAAPQATALRLWSKPNFNYEILSSGGLADGTVFCVASNAFASAADATPRFELSRESVVHQEDTTPLNLTTAAVSTSMKSLWQSDLVALRMVWNISFGLRTAAGLAWVQNAVW